jgi:hypothetical protein
MRLPRFSIAGLMALVVVAAVGVAALRFANELWAGVLLLATVGIFGAAILGIVHRRDGKRAWWQGFALFGWGYFALALGPWFHAAIAPSLPTTTGLTALFAKLHPSPPQVGWVAYSDTSWTSTATAPGTAPAITSGTAPPASMTSTITLWMPSPSPDHFLRVGHCLWALLAACVGGLIGRAFHASEAT